MLELKKFVAGELATLTIEQNKQNQRQGKIEHQQQQHQEQLKIQEDRQQQQQQQQQQQLQQQQQQQQLQQQKQQEKQIQLQQEQQQETRYTEDLSMKQLSEKSPPKQCRVFEWENYSSGAARRSAERMGYRGGGLGKNEDGITEALETGKSMDKTLIFSSSITKGVKKHGFNTAYKNGQATFHRYPGDRARYIKTYIPVHIKDQNPDACMIVAGGNDLAEVSNEAYIESIVDDVIECGKVCQSNGVSKVVISSILPRISSRFQVTSSKIK